MSGCVKGEVREVDEEEEEKEADVILASGSTREINETRGNKARGGVAESWLGSYAT